MTNAFEVYGFDEDGQLVPHDHELFEGKQFVNPAAVITAVNDHFAGLDSEAKKKAEREAIGQFTILNVISY